MKVVGLMSGTSADGVDAALVDVRGAKRSLKVKLLAYSSLRYPSQLRRRILAVSTSGTVREICHLNVVLGEYFAKAARAAIKRGGLPASAVRLIGSHGQTIHHLPSPVREGGVGRIRSTLQIAEPAVIAERTGITTVADFRPRDMAAGGQGAPLTPLAHFHIFRHPTRSRLIVNLGGIGNVTHLPARGGIDRVLAFDTGPGNMLLDGLMSRLSRGKSSMDRGGRLAASGAVKSVLLKEMLAHPFLQRRPPKTTGREEFGESFLEKVLAGAKRRGIKPVDLLATAAMFTAMTIGNSRRWLRGRVDEVIVGGGGVYNRTLMAALEDIMYPVPVLPFEALAWHSKAFEAAAFGVLAYLTACGISGNVPSVTGASKPVVLGAVVPGGRGGLKGLVHTK